MGTRVGGRYELAHPVWRDRLGATFVARDENGGPVSLRILPASLAADPAVRRRFREDASLLRSLRHPNLVPVRELVEAGGTLAIASEVVDGRTLRHLLHTGRLRRGDVRRIRRAVSAGLAALRAAGLPHRLLIPATVVLPRDGEVALTDIAVSRLLADSAAGRALLRDAVPGPAGHTPRTWLHQLACADHAVRIPGATAIAVRHLLHAD